MIHKKKLNDNSSKVAYRGKHRSDCSLAWMCRLPIMRATRNLILTMPRKQKGLFLRGISTAYLVPGLTYSFFIRVCSLASEESAALSHKQPVE